MASCLINVGLSCWIAKDQRVAAFPRLSKSRALRRQTKWRNVQNLGIPADFESSPEFRALIRLALLKAYPGEGLENWDIEGYCLTNEDHPTDVDTGA